MSAVSSLHQCACSICIDACKDATNAAVVHKTGDTTTTVRQHHHINVLLSHLNEPQRRWYVGSLLLAPSAPTEGELSLITGLDEKTIRRGRRELEDDLSTVPADRQRHEGGGRVFAEKKTQP